MIRALLVFIILILLALSSCRKVEEFQVKKEEKTSKEEIEATKNIERRSLIWRNKQSYETLRKYLKAKEDFLIYSKSKQGDLLFLSEYYSYLSLIATNQKDREEAYHKAYTIAQKNLLLVSKAYKVNHDKKIQDYKNISNIQAEHHKALYWYLNNLIFLRLFENTLILYREDIEAALKHYYYLTHSDKQLLQDIIFRLNLPKIAKQNHEALKKELESIQEGKYLTLLSYFYLNDSSKLSGLKSKLKKNTLKNQIFKTILKLHKKAQKKTDEMSTKP